jgi:hypothetical protein
MPLAEDQHWSRHWRRGVPTYRSAKECASHPPALPPITRPGERPMFTSLSPPAAAARRWRAGVWVPGGAVRVGGMLFGWAQPQHTSGGRR